MTNTLMTETIKRHFFTHAELTLSYLDNHRQSDALPIILLHGFSASAQSNWLESGWIAALGAANRRVIALDARGHGESDKPYDSAYYPANIMMQDSVELLQQLGFQRADFIGYSMGARMAAFVAITYPRLVRRLLLGGMGINLKKGIGNPEPIAEALRCHDHRGIKSRHARRFRWLAEIGGNDLEALAYCILSSRKPITAEALKQIQAQTLILVGEDDNTGGNPYQLAPYISNSSAVQIAGCNHFNALTNADFLQTGVDFMVCG